MITFFVLAIIVGFVVFASKDQLKETRNKEFAVLVGMVSMLIGGIGTAGYTINYLIEDLEEQQELREKLVRAGKAAKGN